MKHTRREFIKTASLVTAAGFILPSFISCSSSGRSSDRASTPSIVDPLALPTSKPADWNATTFNMKRALAGAAPMAYHDSISGAGGDKKHVGKHTPFAPQIANVPNGYVAIMFGDTAQSHPQHPNSPTHWYDWLNIRKATDDAAEVTTSSYGAWPMIKDGDNGQYAAQKGVITDNGGRGTVYLAKLPADVKKGDTIRVVGHCKKHGDWVNFLHVGVA